MTPAQSARHSRTVDTLTRAGRNQRVVRSAPAGSAAPLAVAGYTYDALPAAARDSADRRRAQHRGRRRPVPAGIG